MSVEQVGLSEVKAEEKKKWTDIAFIWAGSVVCVPALMVGAFIVSGMSFTTAAFAMLLGYLICVAIMIFMGIQSTDLGVPTVVAVSGAFGKTGARYVISVIIAVCFICWFGFQSAVCGEAFASLVGMMGIYIPVNVSIIIWGAIMCLTAVYGITLIKVLNIVSVPALVLLIAYSIYTVFSDPVGMEKILNYVPSTQIPFVAAVGMSVGGFAAGSVLSGDVTRYCTDRKSAFLSAVVGVIPMGVVTLLVGGILAIYSGALGMDNDNFVLMLGSIGSPALAILVLILATWTTNVANAYSSGFALLNLVNGKDKYRPHATLVAGILGTLFAVFGILGIFGSFINLLSVFIPPVAGCVIVDYWIINKGNSQTWSFGDKTNWVGVISLFTGAAITLWVIPNFFISPINAIAISGCTYFVLTKLFTKTIAENKSEQ